MSILALSRFKLYLEVTTSDNDVTLQDLLDGAESEALMFMDRPSLPRPGGMSVDELDSNQPEPVSDSDDVDPSVRSAIFLLAQGMFEAKDTTELLLIRKAAEQKLMPFRNQLGV